MDPNQPPSGFSADYLNQISPTVEKKQRFTKLQKLIGGILGGLVIIVIILSVVINATKSPSAAQTLAARLLTTETIVLDAQKKLKSSELRTLNSNLNIFLTNTNRDIAAPLLKVKIDVTKLDQTIVDKEKGTALSARLEDARLNATYDRTYAREIAYQLETIVALMQKIRSSTTSKDLKDFLDSAYTNLQPTQKAFEDFNAANG